ncbi:flagellar M-ring protein FliF [Halobacillus karajensis]|uniref:flagellar basal-body MS-ring/collar protein FliF n=1 Tax=Halobacillus karajensis TaxID=195088 RepID=UPI0008A78941|nr:flagellar basal-body MS-ring/collar protein FliF [Halobacillus karajensis]SEH72874.1 flagellar M-ring protein FliF [Halobacillus karajensis]
MKENIKIYKESLATFWKERKKSQKGTIIGVGSVFLFIIILVAIFASHTKMVPLYRDLTLQEVGQIKMDQNFNYFDRNDSKVAESENAYTYQQNVKKDIERDIKQRVQRMLGMMIGRHKVIATVTADIDFTKENRVEELVEPVDPDTMEGLPVSVEKIEEAYEGGVPEGGVPGVGDEDTIGYPADDDSSNGDYEMSRETINNEFNRIKKNIEESPYKVRDIGIQVAIDNTKGTTPEGEVEYLTASEQQTVEESVQSIVDSMITTSIDGEYGQVDTEEKTSIVFQEFGGDPEYPDNNQVIPSWVYILGGILVFIIIVLLFMLSRRKKTTEEEEDQMFEKEEEAQKPKPQEVPGMDEKEDEATHKRKQLEKMARDKPEDFAKLLRSWIAED